jgi:UDP-glucose 4-epimerase
MQSKTYNLSDGNFYSRYELATIAKNVLNLKTIKFHLPVNFVKIIASIAEKVSSLTQQSSHTQFDKLKELTAVNWLRN